ncbi:YtxH domain-containing protein [Salinibacillus xinjiangensis]|uniref:YtxH domain-containing protein n=1 Tax=Salinibacillus xinjiangensis TaxID=1229268 RepID=A0A6G1XA29_9BACI|nr:YtxH domain-containing protein [Salinibacillus xinjiangensis]MRG87730.1 YtxH domain-containing protein [Salinibacillus xinjiangensis]
MSREEKNQNENINSKDFLLGTLIGGIVGASAALLLAPKSGKELRHDLNEGAHQVRERAGEWKDVAYEKGTEWRQIAREKTDQISSNLSEKTKDFSERVKDTKDQIQDKVTKLRDNQNDDDVANMIEEAAEDLEKQ